MLKLNAAPITFPGVFKADNTYRWGLAALSLIGLIGAIYSVMHHTPAAKLIGLTLPILVLWSIVLTLRIRVDEAGFTQDWVLGARALAWDKVARLEMTKRTVSVFDSADKEAILLPLLSRAAQIAIAEETIARAGLHRSSETPKYPITEQWIH